MSTAKGVKGTVTTIKHDAHRLVCSRNPKSKTFFAAVDSVGEATFVGDQSEIDLPSPEGAAPLLM
jgi:hypothetical protein